MHQWPSSTEPDRALLILVVEDEALIALDLAETLEENGFQVLGPVATVLSALSLLNGQRPDAAVLDVNLAQGTTAPVAHLLKSMGVPFLIASACSWDDLPNEDVLRQAPKLGKPTSAVKLIASLNNLLSPTTEPPHRT